MGEATHTSLPKCEHCGARAMRSESKFCEFCGSELPQRIVPQPEREAAHEPSKAERFASLASHADASALEGADTPKLGNRSIVPNLIFGGFLVLMAIFVSSAFGSSFGPSFGSRSSSSFPGQNSGGVPLIPMLMFGMVLLLLFGGLVKNLRFNKQPVRKFSALVVDERVKVSGGGKNSSARTHYFVTLEFEDGRRREYRANEHAASRAAPGDMGIAFFKGSDLVQFGRVPV